MPRKIRVKEKNKFKNVNEETKINKAKKVILMFFCIGAIIALSVGGYIFTRDRSYKYADNPIIKFIYSEGVDSSGYDVYEITVYNNEIYAHHDSGNDGKIIENKWSKTKYLNFNEELYDSGALEFGTNDEEYESSIDEWSYKLEMYFENGQSVISYGTSKHIENTDKFKELIEKYFKSKINL